jgi:hypothetical protein
MARRPIRFSAPSRAPAAAQLDLARVPRRGRPLPQFGDWLVGSNGANQRLAFNKVSSLALYWLNGDTGILYSRNGGSGSENFQQQRPLDLHEGVSSVVGKLGNWLIGQASNSDRFVICTAGGANGFPEFVIRQGDRPAARPQPLGARRARRDGLAPPCPMPAPRTAAARPCAPTTPARARRRLTSATRACATRPRPPACSSWATGTSARRWSTRRATSS